MNYRIKEILKEKGLTMEKLANMLDITPNTLTRNINGNPTIETLERIANALNVPFTELFDRESKTELTALVEYKKDFYKAETLEELKAIVSKIEAKERE